MNIFSRRNLIGIVIIFFIIIIAFLGYKIFSGTFFCGPYYSASRFTFNIKDRDIPDFYIRFGKVLENDEWGVTYPNASDGGLMITQVRGTKNIDRNLAMIVLEHYDKNPNEHVILILLRESSRSKNKKQFDDIVDKINQNFNLYLDKSNFHFKRECG